MRVAIPSKVANISKQKKKNYTGKIGGDARGGTRRRRITPNDKVKKKKEKNKGKKKNKKKSKKMKDNENNANPTKTPRKEKNDKKKTTPQTRITGKKSTPPPPPNHKPNAKPHPIHPNKPQPIPPYTKGNPLPRQQPHLSTPGA